MTTTTELQLTFKSSAGKKKSLNLPYAVKGLSADVVREAAAAIAGEGVNAEPRDDSPIKK